MAAVGAGICGKFRRDEVLIRVFIAAGLFCVL